MADPKLSGSSIQCLPSKDATEGAYTSNKQTFAYSPTRDLQLFFFPIWLTILSIVQP
jgi:hypothetical protein